MNTPKRSAWPGGLAVAMIAALLSGCGAAPAPSAIGRSAPGTPAGRPAPLEVAALDAFVPATAAEWADGGRFEGTINALRDASVDACMARYGFRVTVGFGLSAAAFAAIYVNNSQFPDLAKIARTRSFDVGSGFKAPPGPPASRRKAYAADDARCRAAGVQPFVGVLRAGSSLQDRWMGIVNEIQSSGPVRADLAGFASCLESKGVPASSAGSLGAFLAWETGVDTHARSLAGIHATDAHWAPIFARCAGPTVSLQERLQSARRAAFLRQNSGRVRQLEALAGQVVAAARGRG